MVETIYKIKDAPRLALLADLHGRDPAPVLSSLHRHKPSLICIAGDIVYGVWPENNRSPLDTQPHVLPFLSGCADLAPTFLSPGNHEQMMDEEDEKTIEKTGVTVLDNDWIEKDGVVIGGLTSAYMTDYRKATGALRTTKDRYPKKESIEGLKGLQTASQHVPETDWLDSYAAAPGFHILISHHPEYFPLIPSSIQLMLSGHAHGGQWAYYSFKRKRMCGLFAPGQGWLPAYTKGVYDGRLVVSAGLSNTAPFPRFFNPAEIVYLESP
ncbi:MAG: metallophosphoesterase [Clostridia bacterium]|nr:metallophosphoesterase [Clostridia bacterium]